MKFKFIEKSGCHQEGDEAPVGDRQPRVVLVGSPNVGKSALFHQLTGRYVTVSNYPGTTVGVARGRLSLGGEEWEVIDTPGLYSLDAVSEDERIALRVLLAKRQTVIVHVVSAASLQRMLPLTLQLRESGLPIILVLNMMDELEEKGSQVDIEKLSASLDLPVVPTVSHRGVGVDDLRRTIEAAAQSPAGRFRAIYPAEIRSAVGELESLLTENYPVDASLVALGLLEGGEEWLQLVAEKQPQEVAEIVRRAASLRKQMETPVNFSSAMARKREADRIIKEVFKEKGQQVDAREKLSRLMISPLTGFPFLFLVLYLGLYKFVGQFGAGTVVDFIEVRLFEQAINPFFQKLFAAVIPFKVLQDLFVGEYGILTLGLRYAIAIILPVVTFFFLVFAVIEDSGYLPRLALLLDRGFKKVGLSGRGVIPMVLGFGCDTMATMVTRTLPTVRERIIATLLLALAVPCSAQLGVILALLAGHPQALWIWMAVLVVVFLGVGFLTTQILPGEKPAFYMELPPLRWPLLENVAMKTYGRVKWYFNEILPLFLIASVIIWIGQLTGLFEITIALLSKPVQWIGLPPEAAKVFLLGFFRRDYGAAGIFDLDKAGLLTPVQLLVACVALTLFLPCIAQFLINVKERGWKTGVVISGITFFFSFGVAYLLNLILLSTGVKL